MAISSKPSKPSSVTLDRINHKDEFTVKWKKATTSGSSEVQSIKVNWYYSRYDDPDKWLPSPKSGAAYSVSKTATSHTHEFPTVDSSKTVIKKVKAVVTFHNSKGSASAADVMTLQPVANPDLTIEATGGNLVYSIVFPADDDTHPLLGGTKAAATSYEVWKETPTQKKERIYWRDKGDTTSKPVSPSGRVLGNLSETAKYTVTAKVDGSVYWQDSDKKWKQDRAVTKDRTVGIPNAPTVTSVTNEGYSYTVKWNANKDEWHPVDTYELFYADVEQHEDASNASWQSVEKDLKSTTYASTIDGAIPVGMKRYFMVIAYRYGIPSTFEPRILDSMWGVPEAPSLSVSGNTITVTASENSAPDAWVHVYRNSGGNADKIKSFNVADGRAVTFQDTGGTGEYYYTAQTVNESKGNRASNLAYSSTIITPTETRFARWTKDDTCETAFLEWADPDPNKELVVSGYEVAWGESADAFDSNKQPSVLEIDNRATTRCRISGLEPGTEYWFWIRTASLSGDGVEYKSNWTNGYADESGFHTARLIMANAPDNPSVSLSSDYVIKGGDTLTVGWAYSALGDAPVTAWSVVVSNEGGFMDIYRSNESGRNVQDDSVTIDTTEYPQGDMLCTVTVENASGKASTSVPFPVAVVPNATMGEFASPVTAQPVAVTFTAGEDNPESTEYTVEFVSDGGIVQQLPNGERVQYDGASVGSFDGSDADMRPELVDGGKYKVRVVSTDTGTGLSSATDWQEFAVDWVVKAPEPVIAVTAEGDASARISTTTAYANMVMSIWRATNDGVTLAQNDAAYSAEFVDPYAPFGETRYRAALETTDGDISFTDWDVTIPSQNVRIDFGADFVELAYNITNGDSRDSGDEVKRFLDGSKSAITKRGTNRTQSLTAVLVREESQETLARLYALSRYNGVCFVRTPDGMAYPAIVSVGIDMDAKSPLANVSINCAEVDDEGLFLASEVQ